MIRPMVSYVRLLIALCSLSFPSAAFAKVDCKEFAGWCHAIKDLHEPIIKHGKVPSEKALVEVNNIVNQVDYVNDDLVYGEQRYWPTEKEFWAFGGQCRDYATEKYRVLRRMGAGDGDMRLAIVEIIKTGEIHAVLVVQDKYVLDNIRKDSISAGRMKDFKVIYYINRLKVEEADNAQHEFETASVHGSGSARR